MNTHGAAPNGALAPALMIVAAMASVNAGAAWAKSLFPLVGSAGVCALRVGLSALLMLLITRPWRHPLPASQRGNLLVYGLTLGAMNLSIYQAFERIPLGIAVAIEVTGPLAVVLASSRHWRDLGWALCAIVGLALLLPLDAASTALDPAGIAFALAAAFCWAMYIVFGKRVASLDAGSAVAWGMVVASMLVVPLGALQAGGALLTPTALGTGLAVAVLSSMLPYTLEMRALSRLPQRVFGMLVASGPALAALAGAVLLDEHLTGQEWLAIVLVMVASSGAAATASRRA